MCRVPDGCRWRQTPGFDGTIENVESTDVQTDSVKDQKDKKEEKKNWKEEAGDLFKDTKKEYEAGSKNYITKSCVGTRNIYYAGE